MHVAEFGVAIMLFLVGLELRPELLWRLRGPILGTGGVQVILTNLVVALFALFTELTIQQALAVGLIFSASSTAIALQTLSEKGLLTWTDLVFGSLVPGYSGDSDLTILPLLAVSNDSGIRTMNRDAAGAAWLRGLIVLGVGCGIVFCGRFLIRPVFRYLASIRLQEIFTAAALLLVVGIALAMQKVGLSPALGTFLAGVLLADSST
jgi:Kef-type K+ transport system membrane component KefB